MASNSEIESDGTWIMCYGSNGPRQLCNRIGTPYESIRTRMCPVKLYGYKRGFCGTAPRWEDTSPATLFETGDQSDCVEGIALCMTQDEISALDPFEGFPTFYNRVNISMSAYQESSKEWTQIEGQAYIQTTQDVYVEPSLDYKIACCKTLYMHKRMLEPRGADMMIELDVINAMTREHEGQFIYCLTDEDIENL